LPQIPLFLSLYKFFVTTLLLCNISSNGVP
jgi:hypothetical protein